MSVCVLWWMDILMTKEAMFESGRMIIKWFIVPMSVGHFQKSNLYLEMANLSS